MSTLKDVAERSGVTVTTVSRMLNKRGYISVKTEKKIQKAMKELNYQPNELARSLSKKRSNFIGLIVPSARNMYFCKVIDAVEHFVTYNGYKLLLCTSNHEVKKEIEYFDMLSANKVAGVIIASHTQNIDKNIAIDAPVISIDRVISPCIPSVCSDDYQGGILATEHLAAQGCRKLAYISGSSYLNMEANKRCAAFKAICEKNNITYTITDATEEQFLSMDYEKLISSLLDKNKDIDGIFSSNDIIAAQTITICKKRGMRIPDDIKIIGYDDIDLCTLYSPSITTIRQPVDEICNHAVENIIKYNEDKIIPNNIVLPVSLIQRETA